MPPGGSIGPGVRAARRPARRGSGRFTVVIWLALLGLWAAPMSADRAALIVTLAGTHKLSEYFEWSCRSIGASAASFDMLVFHEGNSRLAQMKCAKNVKFIDLGANGLSRVVVDEITRGTNASETSRVGLIAMLGDVVTHIPRYLVEPKPLLGSALKDYLQVSQPRGAALPLCRCVPLLYLLLPIPLSLSLTAC